MLPRDILDISEQGREEFYRWASPEAERIPGDVEDAYDLGEGDRHKIVLIQKMPEALTGKKIS